MRHTEITVHRPIIIGNANKENVKSGCLQVKDALLGVCLSGSMVLGLGNKIFSISAESIIFILEDTMIDISNVSDDFRMIYVKFSPILFWEASTPINPTFFGRIRSNPVVAVSDFSLMEHYFGILRSCSDLESCKYHITIARNTLQSIMLEIYDCACRDRQDVPEGKTRQEVLFKQFVQLIVKHCYVERDVCFYAEHLCITPRYLSAISRNLTGMSAKGLIDKHAVIEIKSVLKSTTLDVQEIAYRFGFPNKSFFGRYFKKHTGMTPMAYRQGQ